ncbi:MAG: hypothetical protein AB7E85_07680 [Pseudobdellovibrionaceae bacterium]
MHIEQNPYVAHMARAKNNVLSYRQDSSGRIGGSIPVWSKPQNAVQQVEENLQTALNTPQPGAPLPPPSASNLAESARAKGADPQEFGFADLLDMVNPLQHIPLVGPLYRHATGDTIKPVSQIIGGAFFGGVIGAGSAVANVIVKEETGKDFAEHAGAMLGVSVFDAPKSAAEEQQEVLGSTLAYADLKAEPHYQSTSLQGRYND